jgi:hypothetical protein
MEADAAFATIRCARQPVVTGIALVYTTRLPLNFRKASDRSRDATAMSDATAGTKRAIAQRVVAFVRHSIPVVIDVVALLAAPPAISAVVNT